jgi:DNA polymerase III epsilon subunit-like protein
MYLIFDLETTGLVKLNKGFNNYPIFSDNESYDSARIVQIAWIVLDFDFDLIEQKSYIIKRDNFEISNSSFHNITNERSDIEGVDFEIVMMDFAKALNKCTTIVAHNILFDYNVLLNHLYRYDASELQSKVTSRIRFCTSAESADVVKISMPYKCKFYKFPSLQELYEFYFKEKFDGAHDALEDTRACARCFIILFGSREINYC